MLLSGPVCDTHAACWAARLAGMARLVGAKPPAGLLTWSGGEELPLCWLRLVLERGPMNDGPTLSWVGLEIGVDLPTANGTFAQLQTGHLLALQVCCSGSHEGAHPLVIRRGVCVLHCSETATLAKCIFECSSTSCTTSMPGLHAQAGQPIFAYTAVVLVHPATRIRCLGVCCFECASTSVIVGPLIGP